MLNHHSCAQVSFGYVWEYSACTELRLYCHVLNVTFSDFIGLPKNETADSAQPRNRSTVTDPFPLLRAGSGDETRPSPVRGGATPHAHNLSTRTLECNYSTGFMAVDRREPVCRWRCSLDRSRMSRDSTGWNKDYSPRLQGSRSSQAFRRSVSEAETLERFTNEKH